MVADRITKRFAIDLRSEVVSRPTEAMWEAMRSAEALWALFDRDPYVTELEERMAELTHKEDAVYLATGALGNILALLALSERGSQVVMERRCHIYWHEGNNLAFIANVTPQLVDGGRFGQFSAEQLAATMDEVLAYGQRASLVCLENTHNLAGGCTLSPDETRALAEVAHECGANIFVDGARLWNAAVYHGASLAEMLTGVDAAMISLNKGLGAPFGAVVVGGVDVIERVRANVGRLGVFGMHRMGYFAAAALVALDTMQDSLVEDHRRARDLAEGLNAIGGLSVDVESVQTNLVRVDVTAHEIDAAGYVERLRECDIAMRVVEPGDAVKFNVYWEIDDDDIAAVIEASREIMAKVSRA